MDHIQPLMAALTIHANHYSSVGDYSATTLINPPRIVQLSKRYGHLVGVSPARDMASFIGTGVHNYFEETLRQYAALNKEYELEQQVVMNIMERLVSGRFDILHRREDMYDIKTAKVWKLIYDPELIEWTQQQNIYAYLLASRGIHVKTLNIVAVYLDWQRGNALRDRSYPKDRVELYRLPLWSPERADAFIRERLALHIENETVGDYDLPACTPEERWERFSSDRNFGGGHLRYAVIKSRDAKRAIKNGVCESLDELRYKTNEAGWPLDWVVEVRHAERTRCMEWCDVSPWCNHHRQYLLDRDSDNLNDYATIGELI